MPITALIAVTSSEISNVNLSAATAWRLETEIQNEPSPSWTERSTTAARGSSTIRLSHRVAMPRPQSAGAAGCTPAAWARQRCREAAHLAVDTPASSSILAIEPLSGSKRSSFTFDQPPSSAIVVTFGGSGNCDFVDAAVSGSTGR